MQHSLLIEIHCNDIESPNHSHDFHQLILPLDGSLILEVEGKQAKVDNDIAVCVSASNKHSFIAEQENRFILANVPLAWRDTLRGLPSFLTLTPTVKSYIYFISCVLRDSSVSVLNQEQILAMLLDLITKPLNTSEQIDKRILLAKTYLDDHVANNISLAQVAMAAHLSVRQLSHLFKVQLGLSPLNYLRDRRMNKALTLLTQSTLPITTIAEAVGYQNLSAFSDRFAKHFGRSPRVYRQFDKQ
ncbi:AraC family transcriptional regulator [Paraglaciecola sp.]|uniref:AraC family transcriptional regulator n=1 Tax=Paraglaciecola sp. TaxID=1920173 RepID=UPI0030F3EB8C